MSNRELKDRKEKIKRGIRKLFYKSVIVAKDNVDKFEEQEIKKIRAIKQSVMQKKSKIIIDKLKDKIINNIWILFETGEIKEDTEKEA